MSAIAIIWSGVVGSTLASAFYWLARSLRWTRFDPSVQLGCLVTRDPRRPLTETIGFLALFVFGSSIAPALFGAILTAWSGAAWVGGLIVGGLVGVGVAASLPVFGTISACIRSGVIPAPGRFGIGWGRFTPPIIIAGQMIYGAIVAAILAGFSE